MAGKRQKADNIRFSRLVMTVLIALYALFGVIEGIYVMLLFTLSTIFFGINHSLTSWLLRFLDLFGFARIFKLNNRYKRSFEILRSMELFEEVMRFSVGMLVLYLYLIDYSVASVVLAFYMAIMMMISTFFGFCMSGLMYIAYTKLLGMFKHASK